MQKLCKKRRDGLGRVQKRPESVKTLKPVGFTTSAFVKISDDQRFHAAVNIAGKEFIGMLDSGAQISVVGPRFQSLVDSGQVQTKPSSFSIRTADGTVHPTKHSLVLQMLYSGEFHTIEAPIFVDLKHDLILGVDFGYKFNIRPAVVEVESIDAA